ncbi:MAG TPA: cupin domain-containing protein [Thermoanaerobaculia bacterium]|jgi:predicted cupin superfamily sugar epimerase|nr:cupin domain-containing protein [Thermoanaerobaculia bacterium]
MPDRPSALIDRFHLQPHPEGGWYHQLFRSSHDVQPLDDRSPRKALTAIYFLLQRGECSRWHRVRSDEIWTHLEGEPLHLHLSDLSAVDTRSLGGTSSGGTPLHVVPAGLWQAAEPAGDYTLAACFVGPGFEFDDFTLLGDDPAAAAQMRRLNGEWMRLA